VNFACVYTHAVKIIHLSLTKPKISNFIFGGVPQSPFLKKIRA
jgi:hypothetical protein